VCTFPIEDLGLRTDVVDGAGDGIKGYAMT
jgi:hypothetical protein